MGLPEVDDTDSRPLSADEDEPRSAAGRLAARCWALLLARIYECLPLLCPRCSQPMRIIAFILDPPVIERILIHIDEPVTPPRCCRPGRRRRPSWGSSRQTVRPPRRPGLRSTRPAARTAGTEPIGQHRATDLRVWSRPKPGATATDRSARSGGGIAPGSAKPGLARVRAGILSASALKRDVRGGRISRNEARSGTSGGGTMRLEFLLSPGRRRLQYDYDQ